MTTHEAGFMFTVYPKEMIPVLKALKFAELHPEFAEVGLSEEQKEALASFLDSFSDFALNHAA